MKIKKIMAAVGRAIDEGRYTEDTELAKTVVAKTPFDNMDDSYESNSDLGAFHSVLNTAAAGKPDEATGSYEDLDDVRTKAATAAAAAALNPDAINYMGPTGKEVSNPSDIMGMDIESSQESFSGSDPKALAVRSYGFAYGTSKQEPFVEAFFPTVLKPVGTQGVKIILDVDYIVGEVIRDGKSPKAVEIPVISTYNDAKGPLANNSTALTPVSDVDAANDVYFVKALEAATVAEGTQELVNSAPLAIGKQIPLLQLSQSAADLARGTMDDTDTISPDLSVKEIIFLTGVGEYTRLPIGIHRGSNFTYAPQGDSNGDVILSLTSKTFAIKLDELRDSANAPLDAVNAGYTAIFRVGISGAGNLVDDEMTVNVNAMELIDVLTADDVSVDPASAIYTSTATAAAKLTAANAVGYTVSAFLVNDNKRRLGRRIVRRPKEANYSVRPSSPFTISMPLDGLRGRGKADEKLIPSLVKDVAKQTEMAGVLALTRYVDSLRSAKASGINISTSPIAGIARHVIVPYFTTRAVNLVNEVDSLTSSARVSDITAALTEVIIVEIDEMVNATKYADAVEFSRDTIDIVVGTDTLIGGYLPASFKVGSNIKVKVVTTRNTAMRGRVVVAFGNHSASRNSEIDPFCLGNHIYVSSLVAESSDNKTAEYFVSPIQTHITHCPCLFELEITGLKTVIGKVSLNVNNTLTV